MPADTDLLTALQHGDSLFPSGGGSFSWGLEPLHRDGFVTGPEDVSALARALLRGRWQLFDRPVMIAAHRMHDEPNAWPTLDGLVERMTMAAELRDGSKRAGAALLAVHCKLETPGADAFYRDVRNGALHGHVPVVQGVVWRGSGLSEAAAGAISAHALVMAILGAALRLNIIGHVMAQQMRRELQAEVAAALDSPAGPLDTVSSFAPFAEIAAMRHPAQQVRLFAT
ncbi:MAG: urease accessory protein UreF [Alphaproteobacteria bacterium]